MSNTRKRKQSDEGLLVTAEMVRKFSERISDYSNLPTLHEVLVEILNRTALDRESWQRLVRIVEILRIREISLLSLVSENRPGWIKDQVMSTLIDQNAELNHTLLRYNVVPQLYPVGAAPCVFYLASDLSRPSASEEAEVAAVMCALQLAESSQIDRVHQCTCDQFFVASRIDQQYCSTACRVKTHQSSENFKAKRRRDDRERYRLKKQGKVRQSKGSKDVTHKTR